MPASPIHIGLSDGFFELHRWATRWILAIDVVLAQPSPSKGLIGQSIPFLWLEEPILAQVMHHLMPCGPKGIVAVERSEDDRVGFLIADIRTTNLNVLSGPLAFDPSCIYLNGIRNLRRYLLWRDAIEFIVDDIR